MLLGYVVFALACVCNLVAADSSSSTTKTGFFHSLLNDITSSDLNPYAPVRTACPTGSIIRRSEGLSPGEKAYVANRQVETNKNLVDFLTNKAQLAHFDAAKFLFNSTKNITIGIAFSGGGYRAMLNGAGQMLGLDGRFDDANSKGLGGLLQSATYLVGLSGGNWLVGSVVLNNFLSIKDVVSGQAGIWDLKHLIFNPGGLDIFSTIKAFNTIDDDLDAKRDAGFGTSITDLWGRSLSDQFFPNGTRGSNITFSSIRNLSSFQNHEMPYPIVVADGRTPGSYIMNANSTVFEVSPYELGSWDPSLAAFTDTEFLGSYVANGSNSSNVCYKNFDNAGYILGTSSSLFNAIIYNLNSTGLPSALNSVFTKILGKMSGREQDIAKYYPNPFKQASFGSFLSITTNDTLYLCDGGEDGQNVPFYPLIQQARDVDVIVAFDNSADRQAWPDGNSIIKTYQRQFANQGKNTPFPHVPNRDIMLNLTNQPVFFGCDSSTLFDLVNGTNVKVTDIPLVIQMWNQYYSFNSNTSTFKMKYDDETKKRIITNGFEVALRGNLTTDSKWATCVGCAIIRREQERQGRAQSDECKQCFQNYCWSGSKDQYAPQTPTIDEQTSLVSIAADATSTSAGGSSSASSSKKNSAVANHPSYVMKVFATFMLFLAF